MSHTVRTLAKRVLTTSAALLVVAGALLPRGTAMAQDEPTVLVQGNGAFGAVLTDSEGWTLYLWEGDSPGVSNCYDACADAWPPYTLDDDPVAPPGFPGSLDLLDRDDGTWQVTLDGHPLYYFSGDVAPGDANGQGLAGFGAPWHVIAFGPPPAAEVPSYGTTGLGAPPQLPPPPPAATPVPVTPFNTVGAPSGQPPIPPPGYAGPYGQPLLPTSPYAPPVPPSISSGLYSQTLTIQAPPSGIVGISWIGTPTANSYRIYLTPSSQPLNFTVTQTVQQPTGQLITNAIVTSLTPGVTYLAQVRAVDPKGLETVIGATAYTSPSLGR